MQYYCIIWHRLLPNADIHKNLFRHCGGTSVVVKTKYWYVPRRQQRIASEFNTIYR